MKDITPQQNKVLDCIKVYIKETGFPPTRSDICKEMGFKSPNSAETHLRALEKGFHFNCKRCITRYINY